ncbi:MAG: hypothetical protein JKX70_03120 [Phycisphaerales bacterium]|nr:hypothetical protein [Phycisphaerales bacterium]
MSIKLGELLVEQGAMTAQERDEVLEIQRRSPRPFGVIAEEHFGVSPAIIEQAWAWQYAMIAPRVDPLAMEINEQTLAMLTNRQAWQFGLIPILEHEGEIEFVTSMECLARALRFVGWRISEECTFGICDLHTLKLGLSMHYPIENMDTSLMDRVIIRNPAA